MLATIRITVPDRPGVLGNVCSAIGSARADVDQVDVLASAGGRATDDLRVAVSNRTHLDRVLADLARLPGVVVEGVRAPVSPLTGFGELELIRTVLDSPSPQALADQASASLEMTWVSVLRVDGPATGVVVASSVAGPRLGTELQHPIRLTAIPQGPEVFGSTHDTSNPVDHLLVPLGDAPAALLLSREGASFHTSELHRFGELGRVLGRLLPTIIDLTRAVPAQVAR